MRILHIGKYYPPVAGGMERFLGDLVDEQRRQGDDVTVLVHAQGRSRPSGDPPWLLRCPVWIKLLFAPISPSFPFWLRRAIRHHRPDVIHIHMPNLSAFWALMLPSARKRPWVVHWHADVEPSRFKLSLRLGYPHYFVFERAVLERAESIIVTSPQYLEASQPLAPWRHKCRVIPLGVNPRRLPEIGEFNPGALWYRKGLRILAIGRLTYYKGFDTLIRAVQPESDMELVIVGDGEERKDLERLAMQRRDQGAVRLIGEADDSTLLRLLATCDVLCLPSRERTEAFGIVLVEAMRYAKPLLASNLPGSGVTWVAREGQNAVLVPPDDVDAWRSALRSIEASPATRVLLGRLGFERYRREFAISEVARRIRQIYGLTLRVSADDHIPIETDDPDEPVERADPVGAPERKSGRLLVVIPALNEAECIGEVISRVRANENVDVLVVDDGSTDDTTAVALINGATVLHAPLWQGAWGAIQTGIRYAVRQGYSAVVTMDADGQHEPAYLAQLMEAARDADVVIAACPSRGSRLRHIAWSYFRFLTGFSFDDLTSGFRYYNAKACRLLACEEATLLDYQDIGVLLLLHHANFRIAEIPVAMNPRRSGKSRVFSSWWAVAWYMAETSLLCLARWRKT